MNWWKKDLWEENFCELLVGATKKHHAPKFSRENFHK